MAVNVSQVSQSKVSYLKELLLDRKNISNCPIAYDHVERLLDEEISRVRSSLLRSEGAVVELPEADGQPVLLSENVFFPKNSNRSLVGRILGPRGNTAKQIELDTGCKIAIRGRGSLRDKDKEELLRGNPNWKHLQEDLHVQIVVKDANNRAKIKLQRAVELIRRVIHSEEGGELKQSQLIEHAIITGKPLKSNGVETQLQILDHSEDSPVHWTDILNAVAPWSPYSIPPPPAFVLPPVALHYHQPQSTPRLPSSIPQAKDVSFSFFRQTNASSNFVPSGTIDFSVYAGSTASGVVHQQKLSTPVRDHPYRRSVTP